MIESNLSVLQKVFSIKDSFRWLKQKKKKKEFSIQPERIHFKFSNDNHPLLCK